MERPNGYDKPSTNLPAPANEEEALAMGRADAKAMDPAKRLAELRERTRENATFAEVFRDFDRHTSAALSELAEVALILEGDDVPARPPHPDDQVRMRRCVFNAMHALVSLSRTLKGGAK